MIVDAITFFNELDLLELRLETLWSIVDKFVIVEGSKTHQGNSKPSYFMENISRFDKYLEKILIYSVEDFPEWDGNGVKQAIHQRNAIGKALEAAHAQNNDIIITSDADEIPRHESLLKAFQLVDGANMVGLLTDLFYYHINNRCDDYVETPFIEFSVRVMRYDKLKQLPDVNSVRLYDQCPFESHAGWHFSYLGGAEKIVDKLKSFGHEQFNTPEYTDVDLVRHRVENGLDLFGRKMTFKTIPIDDSFPAYLVTHQKKFSHLIK